MLKLVFVRHGSCDPDQQLNDKGRAQLRDTARQLREMGIVPQAILASPLPRTQQSAGVLAEEFGVAAQVMPALSDLTDADNLPDRMGHKYMTQRVMRETPAQCDGNIVVYVTHMPNVSDACNALGAREAIARHEQHVVQTWKGGTMEVFKHGEAVVFEVDAESCADVVCGEDDPSLPVFERARVKNKVQAPFRVLSPLVAEPGA